MNNARSKASDIILTYGNDLELILKAQGIEVLDFPLEGRVKELYFGDYIVIKETLPEAEKRELTAHALGHHFLHKGNHFAVSGGSYPWDKYQERQAEVFAAYLLAPSEELRSALASTVAGGDQTDESVIADIFNITEKFAGFRLQLYKAFEGRKEAK